MVLWTWITNLPNLQSERLLQIDNLKTQYDMENIVNQIKAIAPTLDEAGRLAILDALDSLQARLETPMDTLRRLGNGSMALAVARIACDLKVFPKLSADHDTFLDTVAKDVNVSVDALGPIMRALTSVRLVEERGHNVYRANQLTQALAEPDFEAALRFFFEILGPVMQALPDHMAAQKHRPVSEWDRTAMQAAFKTDLPAFAWLQTEQRHFHNFNRAMTLQLTTRQWFDAFPLAAELTDKDRATPFLVDVGGGHGQQCAALHAAHPELAGRLVVQDLPATVGAAKGMDGVNFQAHDFFEPQPVQGAKFYYLRHILHDWPDAKCTAILAHQARALKPMSRILIDEVVVPDTGVSWSVTQRDLMMMAALGALERTAEQWRVLLDAASLRIEHIYTYGPSGGESVIVAMPK